MSGFNYINRAYGLAVKRGTRVRYTGDDAARKAGGRLGTITDTNGAHLRIRMDGEQYTLLYHPTWELEYLESNA